MGIEVGIAVATVGAGKIVSKLASKGSKIMQTHHRPIAAEPDKISSPSGEPSGSSINAPKEVPAQKPLQNHHFATNKNEKITPQFEEITKKYNLDLNGDWNMEMLPHQGRHPNDYHKFVLEQMLEIDRVPNMNRMEFIKQFDQKVKVPIRNNPEMLYKKFWR